jgi:hypothetical protein
MDGKLSLCRKGFCDNCPMLKRDAEAMLSGMLAAMLADMLADAEGGAFVRMLTCKHQAKTTLFSVG